MKTIGVLTSGGDAPGMNAAIRSIVRAAAYMGMTVKGIKRGYNGLIENNIVDLDIRSVSDIIQRGGTVLYTARCPRFTTEEGMQEAIKNCKVNGIEGLIVIGGDGSFRGARDLSLRGIPCIGIPGTIDNDIPSTEYTIGFDTAMNTVVEMVDKLRDTACSHERCSVVEVMGHGAGDIALQSGLAVGATAIVVPEIGFDLQNVIDKILETKKNGRNHFIIVVSEGLCDATQLAKLLQEATGIETRATILGHIQRGGNPTLRDRVVASKMGYAAVELLSKGVGNRVIGLKDNKIVDYDIFEALNMVKSFDQETYRLANTISI
ncbi:MAG: 6-phosphofructokinase [Clostridia bacterium]|nr:6-phosphofructokinase [Clostridia bacterium]